MLMLLQAFGSTVVHRSLPHCCKVRCVETAAACIAANRIAAKSDGASQPTALLHRCLRLSSLLFCLFLHDRRELAFATIVASALFVSTRSQEACRHAAAGSSVLMREPLLMYAITGMLFDREGLAHCHHCRDDIAVETLTTL